MENGGPLPPHERRWRHPSELGPPTHEPTTKGGRVLIASTATLGLLLVAALALTMTPRRSASPIAASSTALGLRGTTPTTSGGLPLPLVTPVGDDGWGVTTASALTGSGGRRVEVRLTSGEIVDVEIVRTADDVTLVSLPRDADAESFEVARSQPEPTDSVVLRDDDGFVTVEVGQLANVVVAEATPVFDDEGHLVGLCTGKPDARWIVPVSAMPAEPSTTTTLATTSTTAKPVTTVVATTVATTATAPVAPIEPAPVTTATTTTPSPTTSPTTVSPAIVTVSPEPPNTSPPSTSPPTDPVPEPTVASTAPGAPPTTVPLSPADASSDGAD
ncbi:MAG: hypothetical protein ACR2HQ_02745 [Ilumatobacteraceae bacterium]